MNAVQAVDEASTPPGETWPMPVERFLKGNHLRRADVVLTRKFKSLRSTLISWATRSSFSHAALVFLVPHEEHGFNNAFVIEAAGGGVDLTNLTDYLNDRRSLVGIKRMKGTWFDGEPCALVRGRLLNSIKSEYSYATALNVGWNFFNEIAFGVRSRIAGQRRAIQGRVDRQIRPPSAFICSGLVQLGFVHSVVELAGTGQMAPQRLSEVVFREDLREMLPKDWSGFSEAQQLEMMWDFIQGFEVELASATPEDLAASPSLDWRFIVRNGEVHRVKSEDEAKKLLAWEPR